jgi:hypothetical protein
MALLACAAFGALQAATADAQERRPAQKVASTFDSGGFYVSTDGSYQSMNLPTYSLGWQNLSEPSLARLGAVQNFEPRTGGYGVRGAIGYRFPSNARIELGGSYLNAYLSQTELFTSSGSLDHALLRVSGRGGTNFGTGAGSRFTSTLESKVAAWNAYLKAADEVRTGAVTFSPSVAVFGGQSTVNQALRQYASFVATGAVFETYTADSSLKWSDWGGRLGFDSSVEISRSLVLGLGGWIGVAHRSVDMSANDANDSGGVAFDGASSVKASSTTMPILANAEASVTAMPFAGTAVKAFAGLNYDNRVPGISGPVLPGGAGLCCNGASVGTPAGIKFESELSWYAGGGLTVKY